MNEVYIYGRKLSAEELQADSLKRLERLTENTPMAPVDKTPARAEGCGVAMTIIGRDVFDEAERDALRQQLAETRKERRAYRMLVRERSKADALDAVAGASAMTDRDVFDEVITERDALRQQLAETREELEANRLCNRFTWKDRACKAEQQVATLTKGLEDMKRASAMVDDADGPADYQVRLVALAMITREFLRKAALAAVRGEK